MASPTSSDNNLYGLVLVGGKSTRMGTDKALLNFHGVPQIDFVSDLLNKFCRKIYVSARNSSKYPTHDLIEDQFDFEGPLNGILSALSTHPEKAWLVLACDMPFVDEQSISYLIDHRNPEAIANCYQKVSDKPEPLFCIWEPKSFKEIEKYVQAGGQSPRDFLMKNKAHTVTPQNELALLNVNTVEDFEMAKKKLGL